MNSNRSVTRAARGFTLVELLLAATILAILAVGLGAHLRGGISVWRTTSRATEALQRERVAVDRLARDLANAVVYDPRREAYGDQPGALPPPSFGASELTWFTAEPPSRGGLPSIRMVSYVCGELGGTTGLWRVSRTLDEARAQAEGTPVLLVPGCEQLSVRYAAQPDPEGGTLEWDATWLDAPEALPALVDIEWRAAAAGTVRRTFVIPSAGRPVAGGGGSQ